MTSRYRILICDSKLEIHDSLDKFLQADGYEAVSFSDIDDLLHLAETFRPNLILLDGATPRSQGFETCRNINEKYSTPFVVLSDEDDEVEKVLCLELGADDYITKPFYPREVVARIKAVLRRYSSKTVVQDPIIRQGSLEINMSNYDVRYDGKTIRLTPKEVELLQMLTCNPGRVLSREHILHQLWGDEFEGDDRVVDSQIKRLRNKFPNTQHEWQIKTIYGIGYKFELWEE
ncbi:MAG: response regulator transcription factor [Clostridiales bacterium]|nr:response regulator transcription factor [Clostridiales bacterium]